MAAIQALQQWCRKQCEGYKDVQVTNMTTSFRDGLAFCAILHRHRPDLIDFSALRKENVFENNQLAFQVAEKELGIPALLEAEDMVALKVPDRLSILTYVSQYYNYFHGRSPIGGMSGIKRPSSDPAEQPVEKKAISEPAMPTPAKPPRIYVPPEPKRNPAPQGRNLVKENPLANERRILVETSNTRSSDCAICGAHVHLVQRHLVDGKLYHRNCFRCKQCSNTLTSGGYKAGTEPGTLVCTRHEEQNHLRVFPPSRAVGGENKPTGIASASKSHLKGPESKTPMQEVLKTNQVPKPWEPSGTNKFSSVSPSPSSCCTNPVGNKTNHLEAAPSHWTASSAKTQQARENFLQSSVGASVLPTDKAEPAKNHVSPFKTPEFAGKTIFLSRIHSGSSEKDKARTILMQALPGASANRQRDSPSGAPSSSGVRGGWLSPATAGLQHPEAKDVVNPSRPTGRPSSSEKPGQIPPKTAAPNSPKDLCPTAGTGTQNAAKDHPVSRPAEARPKADITVPKVTEDKSESPADWRSRLLSHTVTEDKSESPTDWRSRLLSHTVTEDKSESPADWRSRLKPVGNKYPCPGDARNSPKPTDAHKLVINVAPSSALKDTKPAFPKLPPTSHNPAPSADQPQKKKLLVPTLEVTSGWQKPRQPWEDAPGLRKVEESGWPKKATASVKPSAPEPFRKLPKSPAVSPSKLSSDYIPEEEIQKEVQQIERDLDDLELKGVDMEKQLRMCEGDDREDALMVEWFKLIHEKQLLLRRESELMYRLRQQKLEEKQGDIETELRNLMNKPEALKTSKDKAREEELLKSYLAIVDGRNEIVENLDEDRIRELEEDKEMAALIQKLDVPRSNHEGEKKSQKAKFGLFKILQLKIKS
ncbi:MICAL-like protein 2 [Sphaerodactylus townsendi]|uniref:MICAL-like protein 2 n=1 Tax=Sphaerodactylus townsendi TaxID=933632 RepID=UPI0020260A6E|nr:MICAL-like protein 2 [Sphaerodactylus townsendi]